MSLEFFFVLPPQEQLQINELGVCDAALVHFGYPSASLYASVHVLQLRAGAQCPTQSQLVDGLVCMSVSHFGLLAQVSQKLRCCSCASNSMEFQALSTWIARVCAFEQFRDYDGVLQKEKDHTHNL